LCVAQVYATFCIESRGVTQAFLNLLETPAT
jgi:hypothetical protein